MFNFLKKKEQNPVYYLYLELIYSFQYVVIPTRRSSAEAFQILFSHALGDAGSPFFVGLVSSLYLLL